MMMEEIVQPQQQPNDFERDHCYCVLLRAIASIHTFYSFLLYTPGGIVSIEGDSLPNGIFLSFCSHKHTHRVEIILEYSRIF